MNDSWFADRLDATRFLQRYPAFASLVARIEPLATDQVFAMAIGRSMTSSGRDVLRLFVNTDYVEQHPQFFAGVLQHELHHVLCGHLDDDALHRVAHPRLMELAMELSANENIVEPLPPVFVWQDFRRFGVRAGQSTLERYLLLERAHEKGRLSVLSEEQLDLIDPTWRNRTRHASRSPGGMRVVVMPKATAVLPWNRRPRVIDKGSVDDHRPGSHMRGGARGIGDALDRGSDGARPSTWRESRWLLGLPTEQEQLAEWQLAIRAFLRGERGGAGDARRGGLRASKELPRQVATHAGSSTLNWPAILRELLPQHRAVRPTYLRPNRRFPERIGEQPGRTRRARRLHLLIGVDTSASIGAADLARVRSELTRLRRHAACTIAECDAAVHRVHRDVDLEIVTGGGDTDFAAVFGLLADRADLDGVVYFTDGVGQWPPLPPSVPTLWVLSSDRAFDCPWGTVVRLPQATVSG